MGQRKNVKVATRRVMYTSLMSSRRSPGHTSAHLRTSECAVFSQSERSTIMFHLFIYLFNTHVMLIRDIATIYFLKLLIHVHASSAVYMHLISNK